MTHPARKKWGQNFLTDPNICRKIVGLLDYGDMIFAPTINDLAICLAYGLMNKDNLYDSLKRIILNYHNEFPITFDEIFSLMTLVKSRLTITVLMAEKQIKILHVIGLSQKNIINIIIIKNLLLSFIEIIPSVKENCLSVAAFL